MGYLDLWGYAIAEALDAAGIKWCIFSGDGLRGYEIRVVDENGTAARMRMSPGEVARMVGVRSASEFYASSADGGIGL